MKDYARRISALERASPRWEKAHIIKWHEHQGQTEDEAFEAYGRERIGPNDLSILVRFVAPKFDADGNRIFTRANLEGIAE